MKFATVPEPPGFGKLSKREQVRYLQVLWDRIVDEPGEVPVPRGRVELAERRLADHRRDPSRARPAHDDLDRLAKKRR